TEEYEKIVSTVEDEVAELQEGVRGKSPALPTVTPAAAAPPAADIVPEQPITSIQPIPGEVLNEPEPRDLPGPGSSSGPIGSSSHYDYDRRRGRGRRDRDRRGKNPKITSFESKSFGSRPDDRPYTSLEVLPGESLAKLSRKPEREPEDKNAPLGAVAE